MELTFQFLDIPENSGTRCGFYLGHRFTGRIEPGLEPTRLLNELAGRVHIHPPTDIGVAYHSVSDPVTPCHVHPLRREHRSEDLWQTTP